MSDNEEIICDWWCDNCNEPVEVGFGRNAKSCPVCGKKAGVEKKQNFKTLKDIEQSVSDFTLYINYETVGRNVARSELLRQAAREYIADYEKKLSLGVASPQSYVYVHLKSNISWIKHFFNLEDD